MGRKNSRARMTVSDPLGYGALRMCRLGLAVMNRRYFLQAAIPAATLATALGSGLLWPRRVLAARPIEAFAARSVESALAALGWRPGAPDPGLRIKVPDIVENGAVVPVVVTATAADSLALLVEGNEKPLAALFHFQAGALPMVSCRLKMARNSQVQAVARLGDRVAVARQWVEVTVGCDTGRSG